MKEACSRSLAKERGSFFIGVVGIVVVAETGEVLSVGAGACALALKTKTNKSANAVRALRDRKHLGLTIFDANPSP